LFVIADIDIQLLLAIQYACNKTGTKVPWKETAEVLGPKFTEGAIVQHLAKLRTRREDLNKPCPPPLKRAAGNNTANAAKAEMTSKKTLLPYAMEENPLKRKRPVANRRQNSSDEDEYLPAGERKSQEQCKPTNRQNDDSSGDIYTVKRKAQLRAKKGGYPVGLFHAGNMKSDENDPNQKLVHGNASWLNDVAARTESDRDEISTTESSSVSQSTSQSTVQSAKKSKMVTLKLESEHLASVGLKEAGPALRYVTTFPEPTTPPQPPRVIENQPPRLHPSRTARIRTYMPHDLDDMDFRAMKRNTDDRDYPVQFPSNNPNPFVVGSLLNPGHGHPHLAQLAQSSQAMQNDVASDYDLMLAYPQVEIPYELARDYCDDPFTNEPVGNAFMHDNVFIGYDEDYFDGELFPIVENEGKPDSKHEETRESS
jgi:hypothetical protein